MSETTAETRRAWVDQETGAKEERARIVTQLRGWADMVAHGKAMAAAGADDWYIEVLLKAALAIEQNETNPTWAR